MGVYKEFIEVTGINGYKVYVKVASIIGLEDGDPVLLMFGDKCYRLKDSYEDVKRLLEE